MNVNFPDNPLLGPLSRADFIVANQALVKTVIKQRFKSWGNADDTLSDGTVGLILAYDRYNNADVPFSSFALTYIDGEIRNARSRRPSTGLRIPARLFPLVGRILRDGLTAESAEVVAAELGITVDKARKALYCANITSVSALPTVDDRGNKDDHTHVYTEEFLAELKPNPRRIVRTLMRGCTRSEAARAIGTSRQNINGSLLYVKKRFEAYEKIGA